MTNVSSRKVAFKKFNDNVTKLVRAVNSADYDAQLLLMSEAIRNLEEAKRATVGIYGGVSN